MCTMEVCTPQKDDIFLFAGFLEESQGLRHAADSIFLCQHAGLPCHALSWRALLWEPLRRLSWKSLQQQLHLGLCRRMSWSRSTAFMPSTPIQTPEGQCT